MNKPDGNAHHSLAVTPDPTQGEYTVITDISGLAASADAICDAPSLVKTAGGGIFCATLMLVRSHHRGLLQFHLSRDGGATWRKLEAESRFHCGRLIQQEDTLYFLGAGPRRGDGIRIIRSDDSGITWSEPVLLFDGGFYNAASSCAIRDGQLYWCFGAVNDTGRFNGSGSRTVVVAADFERDLTDPAAWRISNFLTYPDTPAALRSGVGDTPGNPYPDHWLEGNVIEVNGELRVCWRTRIDEYGTPSLAVVCDLNDDGENLDYRFRQFYPWPGAQNHFHVIHDPETGLYWMTANLLTHSQDMKMTAALDRNPRFRGRNQHDNDLTTFHRVKDFRDRAAILLPGEE